jgi:hypothetical protein
MCPLILKRAPVGWNQEDFDVVEDGVIVGRNLQGADRAAGPPLDVASGHSAATTNKGRHAA